MCFLRIVYLGSAMKAGITILSFAISYFRCLGTDRVWYVSQIQGRADFISRVVKSAVLEPVMKR